MSENYCQFDRNADLEATLWQQYRRQPSAEQPRATLVEFYLPLVAHVVERLNMSIRSRVEKTELLSIGVLGLHDAISSFAKDKGIPFAAFARKRIYGAIMDELRKQDHLTRDQRRNYRKICAAIHTLTQQLERPPNHNEIAAEVGLTPAETYLHLGMGSNAICLDQELCQGMTYADTFADESTPTPDVYADLSLAKESLRQAIVKLDEREQQLLFLRHHEELRVKEIAEIMQVSEGRISQIYKEIIVKLRVLMQMQIPARQ